MPNECPFARPREDSSALRDGRPVSLRPRRAEPAAADRSCAHGQGLALYARQSRVTGGERPYPAVFLPVPCPVRVGGPHGPLRRDAGHQPERRAVSSCSPATCAAISLSLCALRMPHADRAARELPSPGHSAANACRPHGIFRAAGWLRAVSRTRLLSRGRPTRRISGRLPHID